MQTLEKWRDYQMRIDELNERIAKFTEALIWCSASPSFAPDGEAREGWVKLCKPLIDAALQSETGEEPTGQSSR